MSDQTLTPLPTPTAWDLQHLETCHSSVRIRRLIELGVVRKLVSHAIAEGHTITVYDGEEWPVKRSTDIDLIIDHAFSTDESWLRVFAGTEYLGEVFLVYGNSGWDVINDYHVSLEGLLGPVNDYAEQLSAWS